MAFVPQYVLILFFLITIDFFIARLMDKQKGAQRKAILLISIATNLGTLIFFKYFNFFNENISKLASVLDWNYSPLLLQIALPLGLSFHVFQSLSYVIEVYQEKHKPENNFYVYALYVMFFPQLVAGPIERPQHLLPQLHVTHDFSAHNIRRGLERMLWGFFKKLVIADQIAFIIDPLYKNPPADTPTLIFLILIFSYQLYCDFSGYCDIAVGSAQVLGFSLTENFNHPFRATTIGDFWQRWHISLSSWLRDYVYYPLAFGWARGSKIKLYFSSIITFVLIGLWHGANWTFVIMGCLHGIYLVIGSITSKLRQRLAVMTGLIYFPRLRKTIKVLIVFILVSVTFVFFRSESVGKAVWIIGHVGVNIKEVFTSEYMHHKFLRGLTFTRPASLAMLVSIVIMEIVEYYQIQHNSFYIFDTRSKYVRYAWYYGLIGMILIFGFFGAETFIYFQF